jgi:hypothetical protein
MILVGISALILGTRNIAQRYTKLHEDFGMRVPASPARMLALGGSLLGLAAVVSLLFRK